MLAGDAPTSSNALGATLRNTALGFEHQATADRFLVLSLWQQDGVIGSCLSLHPTLFMPTSRCPFPHITNLFPGGGQWDRVEQGVGACFR